MLFLNTEYTNLLTIMKITGISGVRVARSLGFCVVFCRSFSVVFLWPLYCLSFDLLILIAPMVSIGHCVVCPSIYGFWLPLWYLLAIVLSVLLRFTDYDWPYGIYWPLCCLSFFDLRILIAPMVYIGQYVVCPSI